jgi:hypothetical protein
MAMNKVQYRASSEGWCVQQETVLPGQESEPRKCQEAVARITDSQDPDRLRHDRLQHARTVGPRGCPRGSHAPDPGRRW